MVVVTHEMGFAREVGDRIFFMDCLLYTSGDSNVDVYTAKNAGMKCGGAVWGFRGEDELREAGADFLLHKPAEILNTY